MFQTIKTLKWRQIVTTVSASYICICVGMSMVWSSPTIRELHGAHSPLSQPTTLAEDEWIGSLVSLGGALGPIVTYPMTRHMGRRLLLACVNVPALLGWLVAVTATNLYHLYAARLLWGTAMGAAFMMVPIYIGEIAEDSNRGALCAMFAQFMSLGFFLGFLVGRFASYWGLAATGGVMSLLYLAISWTLPETPLYLVYKGRKAEASAVLQKLRGASEEAVFSELKALEATVERDYIDKPSISDLWSTRGSLKALGICLFLSIMMQLSGINVILFYLEEVFAKINVHDMSSADSSIVVGAVQTLSSSITPLIVERLGRRLLLYTTAFIMATTLAILGVQTYVESYCHYDTSAFTYVPLVCILVFIISFNCGVGPMPLILVSEMFRPKVKCLASALCSTFLWLTSFVITRFYSDLTAAWGTYSGFWLMSTFCLCNGLFSFFLVFETKGKTFNEIQDILENRSETMKGEVMYMS